uniref:condensin complex subunit 1 n=1 Tax=Myxine glutinosa TaxID=7769 RepID=UPI00358E1787
MEENESTVLDFVIPLGPDDLRCGGPGQYVVQNVHEVTALPRLLNDFTRELQLRGPNSIHNHFDTFYSVLQHFPKLHVDAKEECLELLIDAMCRFTNEVPGHIGAEAKRPVLLATLKMTCYLLCRVAERCEAETDLPHDKCKKNRGAWAAWDELRPRCLQTISKLLQLDLRLLWSPPTPEENFVSTISRCCFKMLESGDINLVKHRGTRDSASHVLAQLVSRYNHAVGASIRVVQLLHQKENLAPALVQAVVLWVSDYHCPNAVPEVIRELVSCSFSDVHLDAAAARASASFLVDLAERQPDCVLPQMGLIVRLLEGKSYVMRNAALSVMMELVLHRLRGEGLQQGERAARDSFLEALSAHVIDTNGLVRSRVLQCLGQLVDAGALPHQWFGGIAKLAFGRLHDRAMGVCRAALSLLSSLLGHNPFAGKLSQAELLVALEKEERAREDGKTGQGDCKENLEELEKTTKHCKSIEEEEEEEEDEEEEEEEEEEASEGDGVLLGKGMRKGKVMEREWFGKEEDCVSSDECEEEGELSLSSWERARRVRVGYLQSALCFIRQMDLVLPIARCLLYSQSAFVAVEAVGYILRASEFGLVDHGESRQDDKEERHDDEPEQRDEGARQCDDDQLQSVIPNDSTGHELIKALLPLVWSREPRVRGAVVDAFKQIFNPLSSSKGQRGHVCNTVKRLSRLIFNSTKEQLKALEFLVCEFWSSGFFPSGILHQLLGQLAGKGPVPLAHRRSAAVIISMLARNEPAIVESNLNTLVAVLSGGIIEEGDAAQGKGSCDYGLAADICSALSCLAPSTTRDSLKEFKATEGSISRSRLSANHEVFEVLIDMILEGITSTCSYWACFTSHSVSLLYSLADRPIGLASVLLIRSHQCLGDTIAGGKQAPVAVLTNVLWLVASVANSLLVFLDGPVCRELGRKQRKAQEQVTQMLDDAEDELGLAGASAEDTEQDLIRQVCEEELLAEDSMLASFLPLVQHICSRPEQYDQHVIGNASLTLASLMTLSAECCEKNLRLLITCAECASSPIVRNNIVAALGDLALRFPNALEPWTPHLYARLRDGSVVVRSTAVRVLAHLIRNDMLRVRGHISELAARLADPDEEIANYARQFFDDLSKKDNDLYNILPDIISRLSGSDGGLAPDKYAYIMRHLLQYIKKERQVESLVEKLCLRFRASIKESEWCDFALCISFLPPGEKCISRLHQMLPCFADKLSEPGVYEPLMALVVRARRNARLEAKAQIEEFETKLLNAHHKRGGGSKGSAEATDRVREMEQDVSSCSQIPYLQTPRSTAPLQVRSKSTARGRSRGTGRGRGRRMARRGVSRGVVLNFSSDEEDEPRRSDSGESDRVVREHRRKPSGTPFPGV